jgi:serine/threonine-protein kinase
VKYCEHLVELEARLPDLLGKESTPASPVERIELAQMCSLKRLNHAAARFYKEGFEGEPKLASTPGGVHRYNAACAAALAGCGQGKDAGKLDDKERARLRREALDWLRADLTAWTSLLDKQKDQPGSVAAVTKTMRLWMTDSDFAGVRGPAALAKLPEAERAAWQQLWSGVAAMLVRAQSGRMPEKRSKTP